jgi:membrane-associated protease RseP (regulator of RpoE activity)
VRTATQAEQSGILYLIDILIALNIALGLLNMLPMLPLDGGHVAIALYERVRTRRGRPYYRADVKKLLPVVYAFSAALVVVVVVAFYLDIAHPVANPFP